MAKETILIVDDEDDIRELIAYSLSREGYQTLQAESGEAALQTARAQRPDLIVLDLLLPGLDGLEVCKRLKDYPETANLPIIMVTAKGEEAEVVTGLELGADDYVPKPFSPRVLLARVRAVLRRLARAEARPDDTIKVHDIVIDATRHEVLIHGRRIDLTYTEFGVLRALASRPGRVFTRYQIVDTVHGQDYAVTDRSVDVQISGLRRKLGEMGNVIETVRGVGYRIRD